MPLKGFQDTYQIKKKAVSLNRGCCTLDITTHSLCYMNAYMGIVTGIGLKKRNVIHVLDRLQNLLPSLQLGGNSKSNNLTTLKWKPIITLLATRNLFVFVMKLN